MDPNEIFGNKYYILNRKLLQVVWLWPYQKKALKMYVNIFIILAIHSMMIPQIIRAVEEFFLRPRNIEIIVENFAGFIYFQAALSKLFMCMIGEKKFRDLYEQITTDWKEIIDVGEQEVLHYYANIGRLFTIVYMGYMFTACVCFVWFPILIPALLDMVLPLNESRPKNLCYYAEYYVDQEEYLYYLALHTFMCVSLTILIFTAVDSTYVNTVYHAIGLCKLIDYRMNKVFNYVQNEYWQRSKYSAKQLHQYIIVSVKIHKKTIEYANLVQTSYSECLFFVTVLVLLFLTVGTIDIMLNLDNFVNLLRMGFVWIGVIIYLFYVSWPGQKLFDSTNELVRSVYFCGWYNFPLETQYLIRFMLMRCNIPFQLTAGPLLEINFQTCCAVLRTALSYFTAVASLN